MSSALRFAPSPTPPAAGAPLGGPRATLVPLAAPLRGRLSRLAPGELVPLAAPRRGRWPRLAPGELALTATLLSLYLGVRGSARALGAVESLVRR
jgi:hypothetical protein